MLFHQVGVTQRGCKLGAIGLCDRGHSLIGFFCVIVTAVLGTTAPLAPVTVPVMEPVKDCAPHRVPLGSNAATPMIENKTLDWFFPFVMITSLKLAA